jgi:hypothetical protein
MGQRCRVLTCGTMYTCLVEFADGFRMVTTTNAVTKAEPDSIGSVPPGRRQAGHHRSDLHAIRRRDKIATALLSAASLFCSQIATKIYAVTFSDTVTNSGVSLISATISYQ